MFAAILKFHNIANQPRVPAGSPQGGEFASTGAINGTVRDFPRTPAKESPPSPAKENRQSPSNDVPGIPSYGKPVPGAVSIIGTHYSQQPRTSLFSGYYGSGLKGAERHRLFDGTADSRIKNRVYFYVDEGSGVKPESGVGGVAHQVRLNNLYDPTKDNAAIWRRGHGDANASEKAIIDAGYDGYYVKGFANNAGVAVLLGKHEVPVKLVARKTDSLYTAILKSIGQTVITCYNDGSSGGFANILKRNDNHEPGGSPIGGRFARKPSVVGVQETVGAVSQPVSNEHDLYAKSADTLNYVKEWFDKGRGLFSQLGFKTIAGDITRATLSEAGKELFIAPLKGFQRAEEKVRSDYGGDWSKLLDVVRASVVVKSLSEVKGVVDALKKANAEIVRSKDRFTHPTEEGYRDLLLNVKTPNGIVMELQVHVKAMLIAKEDGHAHYEVSRSLWAKNGNDLKSWSREDIKKMRDAVAASKKIYGAAWEEARK